MKEFFVNVFGAAWSAIRWSFSAFRFSDILDILIIAIIIYEILVWVRRTKAWTLLKGIGVLILFWGLARVLQLNMSMWIVEKTLSVGILAVIIIFQPELRRGLERLGRAGFIKKLFPAETTQIFTEESAAELCRAMRAMSEARTGALIAIEENDELTEFVQTGIPVDGKISAELLINIFEKNTPLHDGAVIIRQGRVDSATCYLPLSKDQSISKELGTRHRAAIGLSEVTDSKIFVVSEETGQLSMAHNGHIFRNISDDFIRRELLGSAAPVKNRIAVVDKFLRRKEQ